VVIDDWEELAVVGDFDAAYLHLGNAEGAAGGGGGRGLP
jgi:hypothetical protein